MATITKPSTATRDSYPTGVENNLFVKMAELNNTIDLTNASILANVVTNRTATAKTATATLTAAEVATGCIAVTSTSAVTLTMPTGTLLGTYLGATQGTTIELIVDNTASSGSGAVLMAVGTNGIISNLATTATTAGTPGYLTVVVGATGVARFTIMFSSATSYVFTRTA